METWWQCGMLFLNTFLSHPNMQFIQKSVDLPTGVTLESVLIFPNEGSRRNSVSANDTTIDVSRLAVFAHPWSWLGGRMEDPYVLIV